MTEQLLSDGMGSAFAMVPLEPDGPLLVALRDGHLHPRDIAVLWALVARMDWRTGRVWTDTFQLAAALGHEQPNTVRGALRRLKKEGFVAKGVDRNRPSMKFWCVNPSVVAATGGKCRRHRQWLQFCEAAEIEEAKLCRRSPAPAAAEG